MEGTNKLHFLGIVGNSGYNKIVCVIRIMVILTLLIGIYELNAIKILCKIVAVQNFNITT